MNNDKKVTLTEELYSKISTDKTNIIIDYKNRSNEMVKSYREEKEILAELKAERNKINALIEEAKQNRNKSIIRNFILRVRLTQQRKLSTKLNKMFTKNIPSINLNHFYPETKKR